MRPAFRIRIRVERLPQLRWRPRRPQVLHKMAWKGFVRRCAYDRANVEGFHQACHVRRTVARRRQRHIEVRFLGFRLKGSRRIHRRGCGCPCKWRRLLQDWPRRARNGDDVFLLDKRDQPVKRSPKRLHQLIGRWMHRPQFRHHLFRRLVRVNFLRHFSQGSLVLPQIAHPNFQ